MKNKEKLFVVRKYTMAGSALEAIKKDKEAPVCDVWLDDGYKDKTEANQIGF